PPLVRWGTGDSAETPARTHSKPAPKHITVDNSPEPSLVDYSAYPAAMQGDLMRCADPETITALVADHRDFVRLLQRERMCGAKDCTRLRACRREGVIDFDG